MNICEADGKKLFMDYGIDVPTGHVLDELDEIPETYREATVLKAQVLAGGRGKRGLVRVSRGTVADDLAQVRTALRASGDPPVVLCEQLLAIEAEYYLAMVVNPASMQVELMFSLAGGVDVESAATGLHRLPIDLNRRLTAQDLVAFFRGTGVPGAQLGPLCRLAVSLRRLMVEQDVTLAEINPLVWTATGQFIAADAKVVVDDSAAFRHPSRGFPLSCRLRDARMDDLQRRAEAGGFTYVGLPGSVVMITAGAGLGMMMMDLLADAGMGAATFFENAVTNRGDTSADRLRIAFDRARADDIEAIVFYQTLATRNMKPRIEALARLLDEQPPPKPFYFGIVASHVATEAMDTDEALRMIRQRGATVATDAEQLVSLMARDRDLGAWALPGKAR